MLFRSKILAGNTCEKDRHPINLSIARALFSGQVPNFTRDGDVAVRSRMFLLQVIPQNPSSEQLDEALAAMKRNIQGWTSQDVKKTKLSDLLDTAILHFSSTLLLGESLDPALISKVFPFPVSGLKYPQFPAVLWGPLYQRAVSARDEIWQKMKASPNWPKIKTAAESSGIDDDAACGNMLVAMGFNAFGLGNSLMNAFYLLPNLPEGGLELLRDDELLQSMAWELLRNNGPGENYTTKEDTVIPTSAGVTHRIKAGTNCYFHMGQAQRDEFVWKDASQFRVDRFKPVPSASLMNPESGAEPLPTLAFGCPLGTVLDQAQHERSHQCAFIHLAQPFLARFVKFLASEFTFGVKGYQAKPGTHGNYSFDYSIDVIKSTGNPGEDNVPKVPGGDTYLAFFRVRGGAGGEVALSLNSGGQPLLGNQG